MSMRKILDIIGVQMDFGASKRGVSMGPLAIRYGGLCEGLQCLGYTVRDLGDLAPLPTGASMASMRNYEQVVDVNRRLYKQVTATLQNGHIPIVLGGDHSIAAGSISAVAGITKRLASSGLTPTGTGTTRRARFPAICMGCRFQRSAAMGRIAWLRLARKSSEWTPRNACRSGDAPSTPQNGCG